MAFGSSSLGSFPLGGSSVSTLSTTVLPGTFPLSLAVLQPTVEISALPSTLVIGVNAGFSPTQGSLQPTIIRFIKDPIRTGGCPQCGTFMYEKGSTDVRGESIRRGRNFDFTAYREDKWQKCGRCGWTLHPDRSHKQREGSRTGWGLRYDEIQATPEE